MCTRILASSLLIVLAAGITATGDAVAPVRQSAIGYLTEPTLIGSTIVQGPVLFTHDSTKMARGEPCTTVYLVEPTTKGPAEEVWSFHCIPTPRKVVNKFTITTQPNTELGFGSVLTAYQFAGDAEAHGVPTVANAHYGIDVIGGAGKQASCQRAHAEGRHATGLSLLNGPSGR